MPLAVTDDSGVAVAGRLADASTEYEFERADHALARSTPTAQVTADPATGEPIVDVRLEDPLRIPGRVVDAASGFPIEGAAAWASASPGHNVLSDPNGVFDLTTRRARGATRVQVTAAGYVSAWVNSQAPERAGPAEVSVALRPAAPVAGLVTDAYDQPVAGANVWAEPRNLGTRARVASFRAQRATSADDGSFRLADLVYGSPYRLTAQAQGFPSTVVDVPPFEPGVAADPVRIVLTKGRKAWGRVVDTDGGPVAGAEVKLRWSADTERFLLRDRLDATEPTATDERGEFSFPAVSAGEYEVLVSHAEYVRHGNPRAEVPGGEGDFDLGSFTLVPGAEIHGFVADPDGEPVAGATIEVNRYGADRDQERTTTTELDGAFRLGGLPHEPVDLSVRAAGFAPLALRQARPGTEEPIRIELQAGASLAGRVVDDTGNPVVRARVRVDPDTETLMQAGGWSSQDYVKRTGSDGRFHFKHLNAGIWSLEATEGTTTAALDDIELGPGAELEIELRLRSQDQLTVIVTTYVGEPVSEARIRVKPEGDPYSSAYGTTDAGGRAQIGVTPGAATVSIEHPKEQNESREVLLEPGNNELAIQLKSGGEISGVVRSADGAPVALATVEAHSEDELDRPAFLRRYWDPPAQTISDRSGQFRVTGLEPGAYFLTASAPGFPESGPAQPIEIDGQPVGGVDILLEPGGSITGAVVGLRSTELSQVEITASQNAQWHATKPDVEGNFALENLAPGTWNIVARKGEAFLGRSVERTVTLERGSTEAFVELPFDRGLRLSGQVLVAGEPMIGGFLSAVPADDEEFQWTRTDHRGAFEIEGLEPGSYQLRIQQPAGSTEHRSIDLQTDLEGLRIDLQAPGTLTGVILDAAHGQTPRRRLADCRRRSPDRRAPGRERARTRKRRMDRQQKRRPVRNPIRPRRRPVVGHPRRVRERAPSPQHRTGPASPRACDRTPASHNRGSEPVACGPKCLEWSAGFDSACPVCRRFSPWPRFRPARCGPRPQPIPHSSSPARSSTSAGLPRPVSRSRSGPIQATTSSNSISSEKPRHCPPPSTAFAPARMEPSRSPRPWQGPTAWNSRLHQTRRNPERPCRPCTTRCCRSRRRWCSGRSCCRIATR